MWKWKMKNLNLVLISLFFLLPFFSFGQLDSPRFENYEEWSKITMINVDSIHIEEWVSHSGRTVYAAEIGNIVSSTDVGSNNNVIAIGSVPTDLYRPIVRYISERYFSVVVGNEIFILQPKEYLVLTPTGKHYFYNIYNYYEFLEMKLFNP